MSFSKLINYLDGDMRRNGQGGTTVLAQSGQFARPHSFALLIRGDS
jgi:hypothetical protein